MKTNKFLLFSLAGFAASAITMGSPALAHDGHFYGHRHHPGPRVVVVRPPVFVQQPVVVYRPGPVYYAPYYAPAPVYYARPAPVYYEPNPAGTIGGAIAGAAIGGIVSHGRPGAIAAGGVLGAVVGSTLPR
jgi:hypothetical protein